MADKKPPNFLTGTKVPQEYKGLPGGIHPYGPAVPGGIFSTDAHDNLVRSKGFKATHWRHALVASRETPAAGVFLDTPTDIPGYNLYDPRPFYIAVQQLNWQDQYIIQGVHGSHAISTVNYTTYYEEDRPDKDRVYLRKNDIVTIENDVTVLTQELFEYKPNGLQRLKFPIIDVDYLADGRNNRYEQGIDFVITDNMIEWIGNKPLWDAGKGRGDSLSIVYWTKPYFSVLTTPRVFRTVFSNEFGNDSKPSFPTYVAGSAVLKMLWIDSSGIDLPEWPKNIEPERTNNSRS